MTDHDEGDFERDLRRVLADPGYRLPDRLVPLERVHAGAVRRRRRQQAVTAAVAAVAVVGVGLGVTRPWSTGNDNRNGQIAASNSLTSPAPSSTSPSTPSPSEVSSSPVLSTTSPSSTHFTAAEVLRAFQTTRVTSVTALDDNHWWATSVGDLVKTTNGGQSFSVVSHSIDPGFAPFEEFSVIRFVDESDATALLGTTADGTLETTHDGGTTWQKAAQGAKGFFALEAGGGKTTWALQQVNNDAHLWRQVGTGAWADLATLQDVGAKGSFTELTVQNGTAMVVQGIEGASVTSFDTSGKSGGTVNIPGCLADHGASVSSGLGATWLACTTGVENVIPNGLRAQLNVSSDGGKTWSVVPNFKPEDATVGAIDATSAVVSTPTGVSVIHPDGTRTAAQLPSGVDPARWSYIGFTNPTHGFAITDQGQLLRSTDGGLTWKVVTYTG